MRVFSKSAQRTRVQSFNGTLRGPKKNLAAIALKSGIIDSHYEKE